MKNLRRIAMLVFGGGVGLLEAIFVSLNPSFTALNYFIIGLVVFVLLQLVCWCMYSIMKKDKTSGKLAIRAYFIAYILYGLIVGLIEGTPLFDLIFFIVSITAISKLLPILAYGYIYSDVD